MNGIGKKVSVARVPLACGRGVGGYLIIFAAIFSFIPAPLAGENPVASVSVESRQVGAEIPADFVGLSIEVSPAGQGLAVPPASLQMGKPDEAGAEYIYSLGKPGAPNTAFFKFMRNLGPGILRLGGNSQDNTCWDSKDAPHPDWCKGDLTAGDLTLYSAAAEGSGWKLILGINLKQNSAAWAAREVTEGIAPNIKPGNIFGLEIGNEPDLFPHDIVARGRYTASDDARDFLAYVRYFKALSAAKNFGAVGPATCCRWRNPLDLGTFIDGVDASNLKLVTVHEYPTTTCGNRTVSVENLLAPELMARFNRAAEGLVAEARRRQLPIALAETNSASCGGMKGVSNAFSSAVWGLDWLFSSAEDGFTNVNFHISYRTGGSAYNPIDSVGWQDASRQWHFKNLVEPLYYAMYLFARNASGHHLLPTEIKTSANIKAYAVSSCSGCAVKVFVINKDLAAAGDVRIHLAGPMGEGSLLLLSAPKLESLAPEVRLGGAQFDEAGRLPAPQRTVVKPEGAGDYEFSLPNASAAVLSVAPQEK